MKEKENYSLLPHNTFGIDVKAAKFIEYSSVAELKTVLVNDKVTLPLLHIGEGSNLLFTRDFCGTVLHSLIGGYEVVNESADFVDVKVGAGVKWDDFVAYAVDNGWFGAENLSYIPGEVGASAVQNIGAYGSEVKDIILDVEAVSVATAQDRVFSNTECGYGYRESVFKKELKGKYIITYVTFRLAKTGSFNLEYGNIRSELEKLGEEITLKTVRDTIINIRRDKLPDPAVQGNAGSFFMNPVVSGAKYRELAGVYHSMPNYKVGEDEYKIPAAWFIDQCGWKGKRMGNAGVHNIQPLVLVNCGGATAEEITRLAQAVVKSVKDKFGVVISPEVNYI